MKKLLAVSMTAFAILSSKASLACSPPATGLSVQPYEMAKILSSREVIGALELREVEVIQEIRHSGGIIAGRYTIMGSNGCFVKAAVKYDPPLENGLCPQMSGVEILEESCAD